MNPITRASHKPAIIGVLLSIIVLIIDLQIPLGVAGGVPYVAAVLVSLWSPSVRLTIGIATLGSVLTLVGYYGSPMGGEHWQVVTNRFLALFAIWVTAVLSIRIKNEAQREIKTLKGLLPICAGCKSIRDDAGYWNQLETYIDSHSEVTFSHGLCPTCVKKYYPEDESQDGNAQGGNAQGEGPAPGTGDSDPDR